MASDRASDSAEEMAAEVAAFLADRYGATELVGATAPVGAPEPVGEPRAQVLAARIRADASRIAAAQAEQLSLVAELTSVVGAQAVAELAARPPGSGGAPDQELIASAMVGELQVVLGVGARPAGRLLDLAHRLTTVLPDTLDALAEGRLDLVRARTLAEATEGLSTADARLVQDRLLAVAGSSPWDGLSPRSWRDRTARTVTRVDADAAARRRKQRRAARSVRSAPTGDGMAELVIDTDAADVAMVEQVLTDLAHTRDDHSEHGEYVPMDQRRVDAFVEVFRTIRDGRDLPEVPVRRERELGLVAHLDTFFGTGPVANDPGQVRGLTGHAFLDPQTTREQAHTMAGTGATSLLLVDPAGVLTRVVRLPTAPPGGWTRQLLHQAVRARLDLGDLPALRCDTYAPTVAITDQVRARNPRCTAYDCPTRAHRCDLDHDVPWPRGPTAVDNLAPRHRRHHQLKTRGLVRTRLNQDGSVEHSMLTGLTVTTRPEPLPGYAPGEGYGPTANIDSA